MRSLAPESVTTPSARHGFDATGRYYVCLTAIDTEGEASDPACQWIEITTETRARLAFRYRGWFTPVSWWSCIDVWWSDQCPQGSHGNARWELDASASLGDVPIRRVWAQARIYYINTDDSDQPRTYTYTGNYGTRYDPARPYDIFQNTDAGGGPSPNGRWRVLDSQGGFPGLTPDRHPLVLTTDPGNATGLLDGGPHLKPRTIWMTLWVEDVNGRVTSTSRVFDHSRTPWQGDCHGTEVLGLCTGRRYTEVPWQPSAPQVDVTAEQRADGSYTVRAQATSEEGRVVDLSYTWTVNQMYTQTPELPRSGSGQGDVVAGLRAGECENVEVVFSAKGRSRQRGIRQRPHPGRPLRPAPTRRCRVSRMRRPILVVASLVLAACSRPSAPPEHPREAAAEHALVRAMLYEEGLIEDAEVQAKMSDYVLRMRRDGLKPARGYREFRVWLEQWAREHPDRARTARARRTPARDDPG